MNKTTELPTEPGYFWTRPTRLHRKLPWELVYVSGVYGKPGLRIRYIEQSRTRDVLSDTVLDNWPPSDWYGPLKPPTVDEKEAPMPPDKMELRFAALVERLDAHSQRIDALERGPADDGKPERKP